MVSHTDLSHINSLIISDKKESSHQLLKFLTELSRALTTAGIAVMSIESILKKICQAYGFKAEEVISLPTFLIIKIADGDSKALEVTMLRRYLGNGLKLPTRNSEESFFDRTLIT